MIVDTHSELLLFHIWEGYKGQHASNLFPGAPQSSAESLTTNALHKSHLGSRYGIVLPSGVIFWGLCSHIPSCQDMADLYGLAHPWEGSIFGSPPATWCPLKDRGNIPTSSNCGVQTSKVPSSLILKMHKAETKLCFGLIHADGLLQEHQQERQRKA